MLGGWRCRESCDEDEDGREMVATDNSVRPKAVWLTL
jgi:hypothetical protein